MHFLDACHLWDYMSIPGKVCFHPVICVVCKHRRTSPCLHGCVARKQWEAAIASASACALEQPFMVYGVALERVNVSKYLRRLVSYEYSHLQAIRSNLKILLVLEADFNGVDGRECCCSHLWDVLPRSDGATSGPAIWE